MTKIVWLSYDLGVKGDYERLYKWLDNHDAVECCASVARLKVSYDLSDETNEDEFVEKLKADIMANVDTKKGNFRMYMIRDKKNETGYIHGTGRWLFGKRKSGAWEGYGDGTDEEDDR